MAITTLSLNGTPIEQYGLQVSGLTDWLTIPKRTFQLVTLPMVPGQRLLSANSNVDPRTVVVKCYVQPSSFSDRRAKLNALIAALYGRVQITTVEDTTKLLNGYFIQGPVTPAGKALVNPEVFVDLTILCPDPLWYDLVPQSVAIGAVNTPVVIPVGAAPSRKTQLVINGPVASSTVITLTNGGGDTLQTMTLTGTLASTEYVVVDMDAYTVTKYSGGVATNVLGWLGLSDTFLAVDPADTPMIQFSVGTGVLYHTRAWWA